MRARMQLVKGVAMMADIERAGFAQEAVNILLGLPELHACMKHCFFQKEAKVCQLTCA